MEAINLALGIIALVMSVAAYRSGSHANRLSASAIASDWVRDLRAWAAECIDVLSEATYQQPRTGEATPEQAACLRTCRQRLSALVDRGRFLLPNEREEQYGGHKPRAYRGLRHPALDALVAAEGVLAGDLVSGSQSGNDRIAPRVRVPRAGNH
jgi:hypothetical protein